MGYTKCDVHGWIQTSRIYVDENDELRCKECDNHVHSYRGIPP